jgi:hypothetical protein
MPIGWFAIFRIDTVKKELVRATSQVYKGGCEYLSNYHFFNNKLIAAGTSKLLISKQASKKRVNRERNCNYWNDSLVLSSIAGNEFFDYKGDLKIACEILQRFKTLYTKKKLYFSKDTNVGRFKCIYRSDLQLYTGLTCGADRWFKLKMLYQQVPPAL